MFEPTVEITIRGIVDQKTGMVMNLTELKDHMDHAILKPLDHKNLDKDVDFFKLQVNSTIEINLLCCDVSHKLIVSNAFSRVRPKTWLFSSGKTLRGA